MQGRRRARTIPETPSSWVGREAELRELGARLAKAETRLLTIVGPGGMGKTRLAQRLLRDEPTLGALFPRRRGRVWFCDLTEAVTAAAMMARIATSLGMRLDGDVAEEAMQNEVGTALHRRGPLLLVLDNLEQLHEVAAPLLDAWLVAAPRMKVLATSRVSLAAQGEELFPLAPLRTEDAAELFFQRARQLRPDFDASDASRAAAGPMLRLLDGLPLAIELAASRVDVMSPAQLGARLDRSLDLLAAPSSQGRHASLRRIVLDSLDLVSPAARASFAALSVFRDGFTLDAVEAVLGGSALDAIHELLRHSLVRATPVDALDGELRFSFFVAIRDVAAHASDAATEATRDTLRDRHADYYARLAAKLGDDVSYRGDALARKRLDLALDNIVAAHAFSTRASPTPIGARRAAACAVGLDPLLGARGLSEMRVRLLDGAIECLRDVAGSSGTEDDALARTLLTRGHAARELGDLGGARRSFDSVLESAAPRLNALAHARIGELVELTGATRDAHDHFSKAQALLHDDASGDRDARVSAEAEVWLRTAHAFRREGELDDAEHAADEAVRRYRALGHDEGLCGALYEAAVIAMFQGQNERSLERFDEGLALAERTEARALWGTHLTARACLLQERGQLGEALADHARAARVFAEMGSRYRETSALYYQATAHVECGELLEAGRVLDKALARAETIGSPHYLGLIQSCRAFVAVQFGQKKKWTAALAAAASARSQCWTELALGAALDIHARSVTIIADRSDDAARADALAHATTLAAKFPSDDSAFALRAMRTIVNGVRPSAPGALRIAKDGSSFRSAKSATPVDLSKRKPLRRILSLLAERHGDERARRASLEEIIAAGWAGERMTPTAATNRAHVALATLRKLGLRTLLRSDEGGYYLAPEVPLEISSSS